MSIKILFLTRYDSLGASSRLRSLQYIPFLEKNQIECTITPYFSNEQLSTSYKNKKHSLVSILNSNLKRINFLLNRKKFDLVWIEKEALPWTPAWFEKMLLKGTPYILDYDDAIFHRYDQHRSFIARTLLGKRIDKLMTESSAIVAGNSYLSERAKNAKAKNILKVPTVIDLKRYPTPAKINTQLNPTRIVWIGSPSTVKYLELIKIPLANLALKYNFTLRIIGGGSVDIPNVKTEYIEWTEDSEVASLMESDIGVMPIFDTPWEQGKCGYKLIQYMASGLPVVASNVGANCEIVKTGINGYLASNDEEWERFLSKLIENQNLQNTLGEKGRQIVVDEYCVQKTSHDIINLLTSINSNKSI